VAKMGLYPYKNLINMKQISSNKISVVIPTRNRPDDLLCAVDSVLKQNRLPDELLIVDQSKNDLSKNLITNLFAEHRNSINLKYIHDESISGLVAAKKAAVCSASGDIIMFLEDDIILEDNYIENMIQGFIHNPDMMGACGVVMEVAGDHKFYQLFFHLFHRGIFYDRRVGIHGNPQEWDQKLIPSNFLSGGVSAYRREVFEKVTFDTKNNFFMLEDIVFSTQAGRKFGEDKFYINTSARLKHRISPVNRDIFTARYERKLREYTCFYKLNRDKKWSLSNFVWLLSGLFMEAFFMTLKSRHFGPLIGSVKGLIQGIKQKIQPLT
jgi:GT2 family glycosyltransferase